MPPCVAASLAAALLGFNTAALDANAWLAGVYATRYVSATGGSVVLGQVRGDLDAGWSAEPTMPPAIRSDAAHGLIEICVHGRDADSSRCAAGIVLRARDVSPPPAGASAGPVTAGPLGMPFARVLASLHADPNLVRKTIVRNAAGGVLLVTAFDEDPPPARYDHGFRSYLRRDFVFRDGAVAAYAFDATEN